MTIIVTHYDEVSYLKRLENKIVKTVIYVIGNVWFFLKKTLHILQLKCFWEYPSMEFP